MIFVVDTNILFSACLTPNGRIFEVLFNAPSSAELISSHVLVEELTFHKAKLIRLSKLASEDVEMIIELTLRQIALFDAELIETKLWHEADQLTKAVDRNDISFVALALQTDGMLWTGDLKLANHLKAMGFDRVVNTRELCELLNIG